MSYSLVVPTRGVAGPNWPPPGWESNESPATSTSAAIAEWFSLYAASLERREGLGQVSHKWRRGQMAARAVRDAFRLARYLQASGQTTFEDLELTAIDWSNHEAMLELRRVCSYLTGNATAAHSEDFASVTWLGTPHTFSPLQASCVRVLWRNWENNTPAVRAETILSEASSASAGEKEARLNHVFKGHPAWNTMIIAVTDRKGIYQLARTTSLA
jgi:hypothetical protein